MAETTKYLSYPGLVRYDELNKEWIIDKADAAKAGAISASAVVVSTETTTEGYAKSYTFTQNGAEIAVIDIPKDMVVTSGQVVVNPDGQAEGTYLELTLANATSDKIYINVGSLVDLYTVEDGAAQVQLAIDSNREISATIVAGSITTTEIADGAIVTTKIGDGQVTKSKLVTSVQESLDKADSAVQAVATGTTNGTVAVDGTDVAVFGLKSAAYADTTAFDEAGAAAAAKAEADTTAKGYADAAQSAAEAKVTALETGAVATNTADIAALTERVDNVVSSAPTTITTAEIEALFSSESTEA